MTATRRRILVVEDHAETARLYAYLLRGDGFDVTVVRTESAALELCAATSFDLLISDMELADGDGGELLTRARRHVPGLKGIAITGYGDAERRQRAALAGYAHYLIKPITYDTLGSIVSGVLATNGS